MLKKFGEENKKREQQQLEVERLKKGFGKPFEKEK